MRIALVMAAAAMLALASSANAADDPHPRAAPAPAPLRHVTLSGTVKSLGVSQQEPGATPQVGFFLHTGDAGAAPILIVMPETRYHCLEGERATVEGDFLPADPPFPPVLFAPKVLSCDAGDPRP